MEILGKNYNLRVKKLDENAQLPTKANKGDLGYDLYALENCVIYNKTVTKVRTGISCEFPEGFGALIRDRSSVATKSQIFVVAGVVDEGYRGEVLVAFLNPWESPIFFKKGDKIAQMILVPVTTTVVEETEVLNDVGTRGEGGFGSSGR